MVGGRSPKANIELHDFRWIIVSKIEDTFDQLRNDWFGYIRIDKSNFIYFQKKALKNIRTKILDIN